MTEEEDDDDCGPHQRDLPRHHDGRRLVGRSLWVDRAAAMTRSEIAGEIASLRRQVRAIDEQVLDAQSLLQRLQTERSVLEGELRGYENAARQARGKDPRPANDP
jgi:hypothetical protein